MPRDIWDIHIPGSDGTNSRNGRVTMLISILEGDFVQQQTYQLSESALRQILEVLATTGLKPISSSLTQLGISLSTTKSPECSGCSSPPSLPTTKSFYPVIPATLDACAASVQRQWFEPGSME